MQGIKKISWSLYLIVLICFIMPFMTISCGGQKVVTLTGVQIATGSQIDVGGGQIQKIDPEARIVLVFLLSLAAMIVLLTVKTKPAYVAALVCSAASVILLYWYKIKADADIVKQGEGMLTSTYDFGYWLVLFLLVIGIVLMSVFVSEKGKSS